MEWYGKAGRPFFVEGTLGGITFYQRKGVWVARKKTSLTKKRVTTDPAFKKSRKASELFSNVSKLATWVYWQLPTAQRRHAVIGKITAAAWQHFWQRSTATLTTQMLLQQFSVNRGSIANK